MSQTNKKRKSKVLQVVSVTQRPFSAWEKKKLDEIVNSPEGERLQLQKAFRERNHRSTQDVHNYVYKRITKGNKKSPKRGQVPATTTELRKVVKDRVEGIARSVLGEDKRKNGKKAQLIIPFTAIRIEGGNLVIDVKTPE